MPQRKMKKVISIALITVLLLSVAIFTVGCGNQSDFERAEELMNETLDTVEAALDEMIAFLEGDPDFSEIEERLDAFFAEMEALFEYLEGLEDDFDLTDEEEDQLEAMVERRANALEGRMTEMIMNAMMP